MQKLFHHDGSWNDLLTQWAQQCHDCGEDFEAYLPETIRLLGNLVDDTANEKWDGVFGHKDEQGKHQGVCFVNCTFLPGFTGRVLRVRHVLLSPENDFGDFDEVHYSGLLGTIFERIIRLSDTMLPCKSIKIHFRSPADVALFSRFAANFEDSEHFSSVKMAGAWLMLTKK